MIFSELYGAYYNAVAGILKEAIEKPIDKKKIRELAEKSAFSESVLTIEPSLTGGRWQLLKKDGTTPIEHVPEMPLTALQKRWLCSISKDPRIKLFTDEDLGYEDEEPLFRPEDTYIFDKYLDGDPYDDEDYVKNFRLILSAIKENCPLSIKTENRKGNVSEWIILPDHLEYSEKDDKFRLMGRGSRHGSVVNLGRILGCERYEGEFRACSEGRIETVIRSLEFHLTDERNALERVLMHFAHLEKQVERLEGRRYKVSLKYDKDDETEMVIRVLSFGPMIKVTGPGHFIDLIKDRLYKQKRYML